MMVMAGLDVLLNRRVDLVVIRQCIEIIHHNDRVLRIHLHQLVHMTGLAIHAQDTQRTRIVSEFHERRLAG